MNDLTEAKGLVARMTLEEKASLCSGQDFWRLKAVGRLGVESVMVTDGPHGLRKQTGASDSLGITKSVPSTCFPPACATACSFDRDLLTEIGRAIGEECLQENVAVVLGPGANIKRSPLCGRNFEYFSEDPLLAGELAAALINGVQERGVGTSLKHYAVNNQETRRMTVNAVVDERALREIYLKPFEIAVKKSKPWTLMCSYNRINGVYSSDNKWLMTDVPRGEWGFDGLAVTDWGAMNDRVEAVRAGLDLEMPASGGVNDAKIVAAVKNGSLPEADVDACAARAVELVLKARRAAKPGYVYDADAHHALARRAAAESCVLLKNDGGILPLKKGKKLAIIGGFAKTPRYQGTGSSKINPTRMDDAFTELTKLGYDCVYAQGYSGVEADNALIAEAMAAAKSADVAVVFAGLPDEYESEGFDRVTMDMPESHIKLIRAVSAANANTVAVLLLGSPVVTDWANDVKGLLVTYLGGQAGGGGVADVLSGAVNPGGKLAESWPRKLSDNPSFYNFPGGGKTVEYRESIFVGYRYYETAGAPAAWPFGYGLSYTTFAYSELNIKGKTVSFTVENTGGLPGAETAQVYVGLKGSKIFRPVKWLAAFEKARLEPGERKTLTIELDDDAFRYYNAGADCWQTEGGVYAVWVGASVNDIRLTGEINIDGQAADGQSAAGYFNVKNNNFKEADFAALYGRPLPPAERLPGEPYTVNSTLADIKHTAIGKQLLAQVRKNAEKMVGTEDANTSAMINAMMEDMPIRAIAAMGGDSVPQGFADLLLNTLNGGAVKRLFATIKFISKMAKVK